MKYILILIILLTITTTVKADCFTPVYGNIIISADTTCTNANESYDANITLNDGVFWIFDNYNLSINFSKNNIYAHGNLIMDSISNIFDNYFTTETTLSLSVSTPILWSVTGDNLTTRNLSVNFTTTLAETNITDWRINNESIASTYSFDLPNNTGLVKDYSSKGIHLNVTNIGIGNTPVWKREGCNNGGCYYFNSDNTYLSGEQIDLSLLPEWSITMWIKPSFLGDDMVLFSYSGYFNDTVNELENNDFGVFAKITDLGNVSVRYWEINNTNSSGSFTIIKSNIEYDSWNMIAVTYNNQTKNLSLYVNDSLTTSLIVPNSVSKGYNGTYFGSRYEFYNLWLCPPGSCNQYMYNPFYGDMDEIKVFSKTITEKQIKIMYEQERKNTSWTTITDDMTTCGEYWGVAVTPTDLVSDGVTKYSNDLLIRCNVSISLEKILLPKRRDSMRTLDTEDKGILIIAGSIILVGVFLTFVRAKSTKHGDPVDDYSREIKK